ncbi:CcmD family protein [Sphingobacterium sp. SRCM116780]|uniref:CcmD family protein n=1 Tax=Sphingobacterium sp. SRCM116780 TaxID=2907623 RepID=UPI001F1FEF50|nr:CcmD family protein [Sphingobacterium sp. SRCM116780]UIR55309.1 CcmD family protein [Sphingobacterium sp. SRCM116780]
MKKLSLSIAFILMTTLNIFAQSDVDMATGLRSSGKIYVVVLVMLVLFLGVAGYLFILDRKITKLEKKQEQK